MPHLGTAAIHSAVPAPDGSIWLTQQGSNKLGRWDPQTKAIAEYQDTYLPGKEGVTARRREAHGARRSSRGACGRPARRSPCSIRRPASTRTSRDVPRVYGLAIDKDGNCWFAENIQNGQDRQGRREDAEGDQVDAADHGRPAAPHPDRRRRHDLVRRVPLGQDRAFRSQDREVPRVHASRAGRDALCARHRAATASIWYSSEDLDVIGALDPQVGQGDRVSDPVRREHDARVLHGRSGTDVVGLAREQHGRLFLSRRFNAPEYRLKKSGVSSTGIL